jgi:hypothetical protein
VRQIKSHRRGYVLVMTLGLLVLAATLLVTIGRASTRRVLQARLEERQLQLRWGTVSCRNAILPVAGDILARQEALQNRPIPSYRVSLALGNERFMLLVSDEQAKANINLLLERSDKSRTEARIREALTGSGLGNAIFLRPEPSVHAEVAPPTVPGQPAQPPDLPNWISGFGQVFTNVGPDRLVAGGPLAPAGQLTCWGSGAVNIMRVSEPALRLAATPTMTTIEADHLIEARNKVFEPRNNKKSSASSLGPAQPAPTADAVGSLLAQAKVDPKVRLNVALTSSSTCYSLWVIRQDGRRSDYRFFVSNESHPQSPRVDAFSW